MIKKDVVAASTGALATVHFVVQVTLSYTGDPATETYVSSYLSQEMYEAGKFPLQTQQIRIEGLPAAGQDARDYAEALLVADAPTTPEVTPSPNRWVFSGGSIVAEAAATA